MSNHAALNRMTAGCGRESSVRISLLREPKICFRYLAAIPFSAAWFDIHGTKQPHWQRATIALTARCCSSAVQQVVPLFFGVKGVDDHFFRLDQAALIGPHI